MKEQQFREWLIKTNSYTSKKQVTDCISRIKRIESAFLEYGIDLDAEFEKDRCQHLLRILAREGQNPEAAFFADINLPLQYGASYPILNQNRRMGMYNNTLKRYVLFRALDEGMTLDEIAEMRYMNLIASHHRNRLATN